MVLQTADLFAFWIQAAQQNPVVVNCPASAPEPWVKWLLQSVVPVAGGVSIAIWSFVANRKTEQKQWDRNQNAARKQWLRDQKKAEWSALLRGIANVFHITNFNTLNGWDVSTVNIISTALGKALEEVSVASANCIFLDNFRKDYEGNKKIEEFIKSTKL